MINTYQAINNAYNNNNNSIVITDLKGRIIYTNKKWRDLCKFTSSQVINKTNSILHGGLTNIKDIKYINNMLKKRIDFKHTLTNFKGDGMPFINELEVKCLSNGYLAIVNDLGEPDYCKSYRDGINRRLHMKTI